MPKIMSRVRFNFHAVVAASGGFSPTLSHNLHSLSLYLSVFHYNFPPILYNIYTHTGATADFAGSVRVIIIYTIIVVVVIVFISFRPKEKSIKIIICAIVISRARAQ